jgi:hypothetical protein
MALLHYQLADILSYAAGAARIDCGVDLKELQDKDKG